MCTHSAISALADAEKDAAQLPDMRSPFDQALDVQKGSGSIPAALMPNMSEPIPLSPLSTRFTDEGLEVCVSQHLATEAITLEWRVRAEASCSCHTVYRLAAPIGGTLVNVHRTSAVCA